MDMNKTIQKVVDGLFEPLALKGKDALGRVTAIKSKKQC